MIIFIKLTFAFCHCSVVFCWKFCRTTRSSHSYMFYQIGVQIGVLQNFAKFSGKYMCRSIFLNKVAGLRPATLLKKTLRYRRFPMNFPKFRRTSVFIEQLWCLLLNSIKYWNKGEHCPEIGLNVNEQNI